MARLQSAVLLAAFTLALSAAAASQQPGAQDAAVPPPQTAPQIPPQNAAAQPVPAAQQPPATAPAQPGAPAPVSTQPAVPAAATEPGIKPAAGQSGITEDEVKQLLVGKALYLRGGYLDDSLSFNEHGVLIGHSPEGSYTLCGIQIDRVRLTRHKLELQGARYGLHFLGALAYEDPATAVNRVRITPKKKVLKITIDREIVVKPKKEKRKKEAAAKPAAAAGNSPGETAQPSMAGDRDAATKGPDEAGTGIAAAPPGERPAEPGSVTATTSPAHAAKVLKDALDAIFSQGLDERMMASMPGFWKLYYSAAAAKADYRPADSAVLRQSAVDTKARLLTTFEPPSNEFAQANGVAGMALYYAVIGIDGKPDQIAVARPIGFGLDENAVNAIRNARFEPAIKGGKPVPVMLDLVVQFRIYSKRTAQTGKPEEAEKPAEPSLPGPYTLQKPQP